MAQQDHYVAQTFLKHFTDAEGRLHAYSKIDGSYFTPGPASVCKEWNGDFNPVIEGMPEMLGQYRQLFEPHWNEAVEELKKRNGSPDVKLMVALCYANMVTCVPSWRRVTAEIIENLRLGLLRFRHMTNEERGVKDEVLAEGLAMLKEGRLVIEADPNGVKAKLTRNLLGFACLAYHSNWTYIENATNTSFVTSDNPVALRLSDQMGKPLTRFMPITPQLGLLMTLDAWQEDKGRIPKKMEEINRLLEEKPRGKIFGAHPNANQVRLLNRLVVQCGENFVFSDRKDDGIETLVKKYAKYRIESEPQEFMEPDGSMIHGFVIGVRERTD